MMTIGDRIKLHRERRGMTLGELADEVGVSDSTIKFWESGRSDPSLINAISVADVFNLSLDCLVGREIEKAD